ncbi:hypothetical protein ACKKBG_A31275 [Auxenochlorella protothecoides x Auxenochlorella symbiontica]
MRTARCRISVNPDQLLAAEPSPEASLAHPEGPPHPSNKFRGFPPMASSVFLPQGSLLGPPPCLQSSHSSAFRAYGGAREVADLRDSPLFLAAKQALAATQAEAAAAALPYAAPALAPDTTAVAATGPDSGASSGLTEALAAGLQEVAQAGAPRVAGVKLPVTCNDVRGLVFLDQQVVSCFCPACDARVAGGHDRPLFSFTRFERHSGSKAKKWRLSLRIDPGAVPECPPGDAPMPIGQWLDARGVMAWSARAPTRVGPGDSESDSGTHGGGGAPARYLRHAAVTPLGEAGWGGACGPAAPHDAAEGPGAAPAARAPKRERVEAAEAADRAPPGATRAAWLLGQCAAFRRAAAGEWQQRHAAIFHLVFGVLSQDGEQSAFNQHYMPWLNDLGLERLDHEFHTLANYLALARAGAEVGEVHGMIRAYVQAVVSKVAATSLG